MLKIIFKRFQRSPIKAYEIVERTVKLNSKTPIRRKMVTGFPDNIELINYSWVPSKRPPL